jgi:amino acid adenylation domain-containing protein
MTSERRLRELLSHAWNHSAFYRENFRREGIREQDLPHIPLEQLPVVSKADLVARFDEAVTDPRLRRADLEAWVQEEADPSKLYLDDYIVIHSSYGPERRRCFPYSRDAWRRMTAVAAPFLLPVGQAMERPLRSAFLMNVRGHFAGATNVRLASHAAHEVLSLSVFDPIEEIQARLNAFQPERLQSYPSGLSWLTEWALQGRLRIAPRSVLVSGERLSPAMRAQVQQAWNAEIYDLYASAESLYMAVRRPGRDDFHVFTDLNVLEVVDATRRMVEPGARGRVLLTSLFHTALPLIRFDLADYAVLGRAGIGAETLLAVDGKIGDALPVRLADGGTGTLEAYELAQLELPGVEKLQLVHHSPDEVEIRYQSAQDLDARMDAAFRRLLAQKSATIDTVNVRRVERVLNDQPTYKLRRVVAPGDPLLTPASLAEAGNGVSIRAPKGADEAAPAFSAADLAGSVYRRFSHVAARQPEHPAAIDGNGQLTYAELDRLAARVAGELAHRGFDAARPVAVLCSHAMEMLPLILGVLRAGGFYVPLDPHLPPARLQSILADAHPQFLLADAAQRQSAAALAGERCTVLGLDEMHASPRAAPAVAPTAPACLLYTSGSTGAPKGVVLGHAALLERAARYASDYGIRREDRLSLVQSFAVSAGVRETWGALLGGATLALHDVRARGVGGLAHFLNDAAITVFYAVPTVFRLFLETLTGEVFQQVRVVRLGGEPLQESDVTGFRRHFPRGCVLANGYAASETDTVCQYLTDHDTRIVAGRIPAGLPVAGVDVTISDERGDSADGALGEVRVAGRMLASGYWDARGGRVQPFALPFATGDLGYRLADGRIVLVGRRDLVVKVHGYRIDLNEIEHAARRVPDVIDAAAVARPGPQGDTTIVVYYVAEGEAPPDAAEMRRAVAAVVARPAQPTAYLRLAALPRLAGGKIDRGSLAARPLAAPQPPAAEPVYANALEARLARIWRDALQVPALAREAHFFDAGGDSIAVMRVLNRIRDEFGVELPVSEFFGRPVLAELARTIERLSAVSMVRPTS